MFQSISKSVKSLYKSTSGIPAGFGKLYQEGKTAINITVSQNSKVVPTYKGNCLSRQENNKKRSFIESIKILSPILLLYPSPLVGNLPIFVALMFPKQLLTYHFWSDEQKHLFLREDFLIRRTHALNVYNHNRTIYQDKLLHENTIYLLSLKEKLHMKDFSSSHLRDLAACNSVFSRHPWFLNISPRILLLHKLRLRAKLIMEDDHAILKSCVNKNVSWRQIMSLTELQQFCVKRGFDVFSTDSQSHIHSQNQSATVNIHIDTPNTSLVEGTDIAAVTDKTKHSSTTIDEKAGNISTPDLLVYDMPPVRHETEIESMAQFFNDWLECCSLISQELQPSGLECADSSVSERSQSIESPHHSIILHLVALNILRNAHLL